MAIKLPPPDAQPNATPRAASHTETSQRSEAEPTVVEPAPAAKTKPGWLSRTARTLASQPVKVLGGEVELSGMGIDLRFRGQVTHQVALSKDSELVTSNEDRAAAAENGTTWTRVGAVGGVDASVVGLGYNKTLKVAAVVPTASKVSAESLVKLPRDQASLITLEFHPDSISKLLPGSEFTLSSSDLKTVGVRKGAGVSAFGLNAAVEVGFDASSKESGYEKSVVVGQDGVIGFRIDRADTTRRSVGAGVGVGFGVIDGDGAEMVGDFSNERNHVNLFSAYAGASDRTTRSLKVTAQPDITTKIGFDGYRALMKLDPTAFETSPEGARKAIEASGMSVAYFDQTRDRGLGARVSVGSFNAFNIGSTSRAMEFCSR